MDKLLQVYDIQTVYHYTTLNAFESIIESGELWFTRIDFLNDSKEYFDFSDIFIELINQKIMLCNDDFNKGILKYIKDFYLVKIRNGMSPRKYNFSCCIDGDYIPMWNYYSDSMGISIGIDREILYKCLQENNFNRISQHKAVYSKDIKNETISFFLNDALECANNNIHLKVEEIFKLIEVKFFNLSFYGESFKHHMFEFEKEIKFIYTLSDDKHESINYSFSQMNVKPYIKLKIDKSKWGNIIKSITISPLNTSEYIVNGLREYLEAKGISTNNITISNSVCPLRQIK